MAKLINDSGEPWAKVTFRSGVTLVFQFTSAKFSVDLATAKSFADYLNTVLDPYFPCTFHAKVVTTDPGDNEYTTRSNAPLNFAYQSTLTNMAKECVETLAEHYFGVDIL